MIICLAGASPTTASAASTTAGEASASARAGTKRLIQRSVKAIKAGSVKTHTTVCMADKMRVTAQFRINQMQLFHNLFSYTQRYGINQVMLPYNQCRNR